MVGFCSGGLILVTDLVSASTCWTLHGWISDDFSKMLTYTSSCLAVGLEVALTSAAAELRLVPEVSSDSSLVAI